MPLLSVITVTSRDFSIVRRTILFLQQQTISDQIEVIVICESLDKVADHKVAEISGFEKFVFYETHHPITQFAEEMSTVAHTTTAPVVAFIDNHAYPFPDWVEEVLKSHQQYDVVGFGMHNANPATTLSWLELLLSYPQQSIPRPSSEVSYVPFAQFSIKKKVIDEIEAQGEFLIGRNSEINKTILQLGYKMYLNTDAVLSHANPSTWRSATFIHFNAGRYDAAKRVKEKQWSLIRRMIYIFGSPLIPFVRMWRFWNLELRIPVFYPMRMKLLPTLFVIVVYMTIGEVLAFLFGMDNALKHLETVEYDRLSMVTESDRDMLLGNVDFQHYQNHNDIKDTP